MQACHTETWTVGVRVRRDPLTTDMLWTVTCALDDETAEDAWSGRSSSFQGALDEARRCVATAVCGSLIWPVGVL